MDIIQPPLLVSGGGGDTFSETRVISVNMVRPKVEAEIWANLLTWTLFMQYISNPIQTQGGAEIIDVSREETKTAQKKQPNTVVFYSVHSISQWNSILHCKFSVRIDSKKKVNSLKISKRNCPQPSFLEFRCFVPRGPNLLPPPQVVTKPHPLSPGVCTLNKRR